MLMASSNTHLSSHHQAPIDKETDARRNLKVISDVDNDSSTTDGFLEAKNRFIGALRIHEPVILHVPLMKS